MTLVTFGLFKLIEFEQQALNNQTKEISIENNSEIRGSVILDIFVNKKSALVLVVDDSCDENTECKEYLINLFLELLNIKKSTLQVLIFDVASALERKDTNLDIAMQKLNVQEFPALILIENGVEISRKVGIINENDDLYIWLVENGIVVDEENIRN